MSIVLLASLRMLGIGMDRDMKGNSLTYWQQ